MLLILFLFNFQGTNYDARYPYIIVFLTFLFGGICGLFLPETLHQKLPDSLEEARKFGRDQVYGQSVFYFQIKLIQVI